MTVDSRVGAAGGPDLDCRRDARHGRFTTGFQDTTASQTAHVALSTLAILRQIT
jgi:hypothetical protein